MSSRIGLLFVLLSLLSLSAHAGNAAGTPKWKPTPKPCKCVGLVAALPSNLSNPIWKVMSVLMMYLEIMPAPPHRLALIAAAMFDAHAFARGKGARLTNVKPAKAFSKQSANLRAAYAGYASMRIAFTDNEIARDLLDEDMRDMGFKNKQLRDVFGAPFAMSVMGKYPLNMMPNPYSPPNPPSTDGMAACDKLKDPNGWQPLCVHSLGTPLNTCTPQGISFLPLINATLISSEAKVSVQKILKGIPPALKFNRPLTDLTKVKNSKFAKDFLHMFRKTAKLNDERKTIAEVFANNAVRDVLRLLILEVAKRDISGQRTVSAFFTTAGSMRDAFVGSATAKLTFNSIRPLTVLQCALRGQTITAWRGPYRGVGEFKVMGNDTWTTFVATPSFPGYPSGHSSVSAAGMVAMRALFGVEIKSANCVVLERGRSRIEGFIPEGNPGYAKGFTDVANKGYRSRGYSPAKDITICWKSWNRYAELVSASRIFGGIHTTTDVVQGEKIGKRAAKAMVTYMNKLKS